MKCFCSENCPFYFPDGSIHRLQGWLFVEDEMLNSIFQFLGMGSRSNASTASAYTRRFSSRQRKFLEEEILRGVRPEQPCWADVSMRNRVLSLTAKHFGDDWNWSVQFLLSVYLLNPASTEEIDQIAQEHVESRSGAFDSEMYVGRGWNPAEVANFREDNDRYWRIYRTNSPGRWSSFELLRDPSSSEDVLKPSGFHYDGERGCVRNIVTSLQVDVSEAPACIGTFLQMTENIVSKALPEFDISPIAEAIKNGEGIEIAIGSARVAYSFNIVPPDWTIGAGERRHFNLALSHI